MLAFSGWHSLNFYPFLSSEGMADLLLYCVSFFPFCFVHVSAGEVGGCEDVEVKWGGGHQYIHVYVGTHICKDQKLIPGVALNCSPPYLLKQGLSLNVELTDLGRPVGQNPAILLFVPFPCWDHSCAWLLCKYRGPKFRSSCLCSKHLINWAISQPPWQCLNGIFLFYMLRWNKL